MSVNDQDGRDDLVGDGATTVFTYTFKILVKDDIQVLVDGTAKVVDTDYTVSGVGAAGGGTVTFTTAPANTLPVTLLRKQPFKQTSVYVANEAFPSARVEKDYDKLEMQLQQVREQLTRALTLAPKEAGTVAKTQLPAATARASQYLYFDVSGNLSTIAAAVPTDTPVTAFMKTVLDDATAAAARTTLGAAASSDLTDYVAKAGSTMTGDLTLSGASLVEAEGAAVAAASSTNIWATDGNTVHVTGNTGIADFATAPQAGAWMKVIFDGTPILTQSANLNLNAGGANVTIEAGDLAHVYADTTTQMDVFVVRKSGAAVVASATGATLGTEQATTSGTAFDFTGIPAGTKEIKIMFVGVSTSGTSDYLIQIGDAGGIEATSYTATASRENGTIATSTAGFIVTSTIAATSVLNGTVTLTLENATNFTWTGTSMLGMAASMVYAGGSKSLSAELTQLRITTVNGTDAFDAGAINIQYRS